jgi:hypothetical protein
MYTKPTSQRSPTDVARFRLQPYIQHRAFTYGHGEAADAPPPTRRPFRDSGTVPQSLQASHHLPSAPHRFMCDIYAVSGYGAKPTHTSSPSQIFQDTPRFTAVTNHSKGVLIL